MAFREGVAHHPDGAEESEEKNLHGCLAASVRQTLTFAEHGRRLVLVGELALFASRSKPPVAGQEHEPGVDTEFGSLRSELQLVGQGPHPAPVPDGVDGVMDAGPPGGAGVPSRRLSNSSPTWKWWAMREARSSSFSGSSSVRTPATEAWIRDRRLTSCEP